MVEVDRLVQIGEGHVVKRYAAIGIGVNRLGKKALEGAVCQCNVQCASGAVNPHLAHVFTVGELYVYSMLCCLCAPDTASIKSVYHKFYIRGNVRSTVWIGIAQVEVVLTIACNICIIAINNKRTYHRSMLQGTYIGTRLAIDGYFWDKA